MKARAFGHLEPWPPEYGPGVRVVGLSPCPSVAPATLPATAPVSRPPLQTTVCVWSVQLYILAPGATKIRRVHAASWITAAKGRLIGYVRVHRGRCPDPTQLGELCAASCDPVRGACHQSLTGLPHDIRADETTDGQIAAIACTRGTVLPATNTLLKALASRAVPG
jgi:hypothetical protein